MLKSFLIVFRFFSFWLIFFILDRILFLAYFPGKLKDVTLSEFFQTLINGIHMDASMAGYIALFPLLLFITVWFFPKLRLNSYLLKGFVLTLIIIFSIINVFNFNIYREWGSKINYRALDFAFNSTREAISSGSSSPVLASLAILFGMIFLSIYISRKLIIYRMPASEISVWKKILAGIVFISVTFFFIRGGLGTSPINQSMAYFSDKPFLNHAAINTEWNLIHDVLNNNYVNKNPYNYYTKEQAKKIVDELYGDRKGETTRILKVKNPNIVLIILESYTADVIESMGGEKGVAPNMEKLIDQGLFFNNIYASGDRTDKGVTAILSAFPSQAIRSIMKFNDKQEKLPAIPQLLAQKGYYTSYYYGGQSEFFNIKSYVLSHGYKKLTDIEDFEKNALSNWGAFDHKVFEKNARDLDSHQQPFFSTIMTLSNHEPFQLPGKPQFPGENLSDKFRSTAYYTDASLGKYLESVKNKSWYPNTLFIIVADHGHRLPKNKHENYDPARFRIPLLFFGNALKDEFRGKIISKTGNQTDIAATLLSQLDIPATKFSWSYDLLNPTSPEFSFFNWDNGFGFATKNQVISLDNISKKIIFRKEPGNLKESQSSERIGKAYMQQVFQEFIDY